MNILQVSSGRGATKTALVYRSNLNFRMVQKYIALLQGKGFLEVLHTRSGSTMYRTTETGSEALSALENATKLVFEEATR